MELQVWVGVLSVLAIVAAGISLYVSVRAGSLHDLRSQVRALDADLTDLNDRVEHWRGRDAVRKMREGQLQHAIPAAPARGTPEFKAHLRARARNNGAAS